MAPKILVSAGFSISIFWDSLSVFVFLQWNIASSEHCSVQSWLDLHRHQLLQQKLACIWNLDLANVLSGLTPSTIVLAFAQIGLAEEPTGVANVDSVAIRNIEKSLFQESGRAMRHHTVSFHFSESKTSVTCSTFGWLSCEDLSGSASSWVDLVAHHVLQSLIIGRI